MIVARPIRIGILIFFAAFLFFALQVPDALMHVDPAVYNEQIEKLELTKRTAHFLYYAIGIGINSLSPFSTDRPINYLSSLCAALTLLRLGERSSHQCGHSLSWSFLGFTAHHTLFAWLSSWLFSER